MQLVSCADRFNIGKHAKLAGQRRPYMFDRTLAGSVNRHAKRLRVPLPYKVFPACLFLKCSVNFDCVVWRFCQAW